ncbi:MAG: DoxX family protein [Pseudomonadota bacterium]|nr:DoxX family protein [Pseudomonadota bacterium]
MLTQLNNRVAQILTQPTIASIISILMRLMLSFIFITAGWSKIAGYAQTQGYMESMGVPAILLPLVIFIELIGGIAILIGFQTRLFALGLAVFCVMSGVLFHAEESTALLKNIAIAGGFLALVLFGAGRISVDREMR